MVVLFWIDIIKITLKTYCLLGIAFYIRKIDVIPKERIKRGNIFMTKSEDKKGNNGKEKDSLGEKAKKSLDRFTTKVGEKFEEIRNNETVEELRHFGITHKRDIFIYIVLIVSLILCFFRPFLGNFIIGIVVGLYFAEDLVEASRRLNHFIESQGLFRIIIFCFTGVALLLAAPGIFLGVILATGAKLLIAPKK